MDMGLLRIVKSAAAKIFGATETAAAPPAQWEQEAGKHSLDVAQVEVKSADKAVLSGSGAATEEAGKTTLGIGDPAGVATTQDDIASAAAAESKFYAVQPGDTLRKIAAAEYGHGHDWEISAGRLLCQG